MIAHNNGIGGTYFDCYPLGRYNVAMAQDAANQDTSIEGGTIAQSTGEPLSICKQNASLCACWCYFDNVIRPGVGRVALGSTCRSPTQLTDPMWD
jgi:hypothetical protein